MLPIGIFLSYTAACILLVLAPDPDNLLAIGRGLSQGKLAAAANYDADNPQKLLYGRFDFWATGELLGAGILKKQGLRDKIQILFGFHQTEMYLACNPGIEQSRIDHYNQILKEMDKDGSCAAIEKNI